MTYIISDVERETFLDLEGGQEFDAFIEAFWRKRDTNPTTIENEFREEYDERLTYVNEFFGRDTFRPGWMTDRGRYFLILGPPTERQNYEGFDDIYPVSVRPDHVGDSREARDPWCIPPEERSTKEARDGEKQNRGDIESISKTAVV